MFRERRAPVLSMYWYTIVGTFVALGVVAESVPVRAVPSTAQEGGKNNNLRDGYPLKFEEIKATLAELEKLPANLDPAVKDRAAALQKIKAYRFLCGVPYKHLTLDDKYNEHCEAAAKICQKLNRLDHNPPNPGMPEAEYKLGLEGAKKSNLAAGFPKISLVKSVEMWMDDSDPGNITMLGHRRWCLSPAMGKTGFGVAGGFSAMWAVDLSHQAPAPEHICYPAKGFMPVEFFPATFAWSVMLDPKKFQIPDDAKLDIKISPVDLAGKKTGDALALNHKSVNRAFAGVPLCAIFRPDKSAVAAGKRYLVEFDGVNLKSGAAAKISYPVEFVSLAAGPAN